MRSGERVLAAVVVIMIAGWLSAEAARSGAVSPWTDQRVVAQEMTPGSKGILIAGSGAGKIAAMVPGDPVNLSAALTAASNYLRKMQADITEDNAGNGSGASESPNDPDDGGWDWDVVSPPAPFFHTTAASPKNIYGATVLGLYYGYLRTNNASFFTAMTDAAGKMAADPDIRSASSLIFLMLYNDLPGVVGTAYKDAAKAKFDGRIATYGSATALAQAIRDERGVTEGLPNGIIGWDIGAWAKAAAMLKVRYPGDPYDYATAAADIAEVLWQDSFNDNPGYFDVVDDAGWDPTYSNVNYYWYTLGITGLIDAFVASGTHTAEIPGLVARIKASQYPTGAVSYSYGANANDEDWQSTAYAAMSLASVDRPTYQVRINHLAYWIGATQDASGGWKYSDNTHYPEMAGECASALALGQPPSYVLVDDGFASQTDVDIYNTANGTDYVFGYDAFGTIQAGVNAVSGSTVMVLPGTYMEQVEISKPLTLIGSGQGVTVIQSPVTLTKSFTNPATNKPVIYVHDADSVTIEDLTVDGLGRGNTNNRFEGIAYFNAGGTIRHSEVKDVRETAINGNQHGIGVYAYVSAAPNRQLDVTDCHVHGFQKGGIVLNGTGLSTNVSGCNVEGYGPANFIAMNGIQIGFGATGTIASNRVSGCSYTGANASSAGLLLYNSTGPVTASGNTIADCQIGINYLYVGGTISGNTVSATPSGTGLTNYWGIVADPGVGKARQPAPQPFDNQMNAVSVRRTDGSLAASAALITTLVDRNVVDGGGGGTGIEGDAYGTEVLNLTASEDSVTNCEAGIVLYRDPTAALSATLIGNVLTGNLYGLYNWISQINATGNKFINNTGTNANDDKAGNHYDANCWSDYNGFAPYHVGGSGGNLDNNPKPECGVACYCPKQGNVHDDAVVDVNDVIRIIGIAFLNGLSPQDARCPRQRADVNNDGVVNVDDVIYIINTAFLNGPAPVNPCGP